MAAPSAGLKFLLTEIWFGYVVQMTIAGLSITGQAFSPVTKMSDSFAGPTFPADGLAGMGFQGLAHTYSPPFFRESVALYLAIPSCPSGS